MILKFFIYKQIKLKFLKKLYYKESLPPGTTF
jgi:hypothetical protein